MPPPSNDYFSGEQWTVEAIAAWLAGFFENAGELDVRTASVVLTFDGRDGATVRALRQRFGAGGIVERFGRRQGVAWRVVEPAHVRTLLWTMWPYLTSSRDRVAAALNRIEQFEKRERARHERDREIIASHLRGRSRNAIAQALGIAIRTVAKTIERFEEGPPAPLESDRDVVAE